MRREPCATTSGFAQHRVDGRRYLMWPSEREGRAPILLLFHGWSSSPEKVAASSGLPTRAAAAGWTVVAPQGSGAPARWALPGRLDGPDDVAFVERVVSDAATRACVDLGRIVAAGFSNGAAFAALLACRIDLAGAVLVGGAGLGTPCPAAMALPMVLAHGEGDRVVRLAGGPVLGGRLHAAGFGAAVRAWEEQGATVTAVTVPGWGHRWPPAVNELVLATFAA